MHAMGISHFEGNTGIFSIGKGNDKIAFLEYLQTDRRDGLAHLHFSFPDSLDIWDIAKGIDDFNKLSILTLFQGLVDPFYESLFESLLPLVKARVRKINPETHVYSTKKPSITAVKIVMVRLAQGKYPKYLQRIP